MDDLFPQRPRGMHLRTYAVQLDRALHLEGKMGELESAFMDRIANLGVDVL